MNTDTYHRFMQAAIAHDVQTMHSILDMPGASELIKEDNYAAFTIVVTRGYTCVVKKMLLKLSPDEQIALISMRRFDWFKWAIHSGNVDLIKFVISVCDAKLLTKICLTSIGGWSIIQLTINKKLYGLRRLLHAGGFAHGFAEGNPRAPSAEFCEKVAAAYKFTAPPSVIIMTLDAGRDLLGWVLAAKRADMALPSEIIDEIFSRISPCWSKILAAMRTSQAGEPLLCRAQFLQAVLVFWP